MVKGIKFYALYKSRVLMIACKADDSCLFIGLPDEIYEMARGIFIQFKVNFFIVLWSNLQQILHY